ncbi:hypothetical protein L3X38_014489 [Prunus dulcis]|uniref:Uncharacterized protein n=1 Tax=Prunus dulcis TaxID=3755 RepID=A0AAD4WN98_PRUDU|nr:hypothetical protein L3X38_014489 [Prunus dulcis]
MTHASSRYGKFSEVEGFEIEGNEEDTVNFTSGEHTQIRIHPSPPQDEHKKDDVRSGPELSIWAGNIPSEANSGRTGCEQIQQEKGLILHLDIAVLELNPYLR